MKNSQIRFLLVIRFFSRFPLAFIPVIGFFRTPSWNWIFILFLFIFLSKSVEWLIRYIFSFSEIHNFIKEFVGHDRKFNLQRDQKLDSVITDGDFQLAKRKKSLVGKFMKESDKGYKLTINPVHIYYAKPIKNTLLSSCKAYVYGMGLFFVVNRTPDIDKNGFESFLINHELQHINDAGFYNKLTVAISQYLYFVNIFVFFVFAKNAGDYIFIVAYGIFMYYQRFINIEINREIIADMGALLKMKEQSEVLKVIEILIKNFEVTLKRNKSKVNSMVAIARLKHIQTLKENLNNPANGKIIGNNLGRHIPLIVENNLGVMITTALSLRFSCTKVSVQVHYPKFCSVQLPRAFL